MVVLFACSSIVIAIERGTSSKPSSEDLDLLDEDYGNLALKVENDDHCSNSYSEGDFDLIFNHLPLEYVETNEGKGIHQEEDYNDENTEEFCPRLVYVEYYKEKQVETASTLSLAAPCMTSTALTTSQMMYDKKLLYGDYDVDNDLRIGAFHGYGEDDDIEEKRDLKRRIEEFIEKNNEKWKEDRLTENLLYYEPAEWQFAVAG